MVGCGLQQQTEPSGAFFTLRVVIQRWLAAVLPVSVLSALTHANNYSRVSQDNELTVIFRAHTVLSVVPLLCVCVYVCACMSSTH